MLIDYSVCICPNLFYTLLAMFSIRKLISFNKMVMISNASLFLVFYINFFYISFFFFPQLIQTNHMYYHSNKDSFSIIFRIYKLLIQL